MLWAPWFSISSYLVAVFLLIDFVVSFLRWRWSSKAEEGSIRCVMVTLEKLEKISIMTSVEDPGPHEFVSNLPPGSGFAFGTWV